jgi:two-component system KDP operon response regulator KdpE
MSRKSRVLVVEDDPKIQRLLRAQLALRDFEVVVAGTGPEAVAAVADDEPDVVLLDVDLPGMSGLDVCRELRAWSSVPILLVTGNDLPETKIAALESGADDYVTKPFHTGELVARIRATLRRASAAPAAPPVLTFGDITIDLAHRQVHRAGEAVHLTKIEFDLLRELVTNPDRVLTFDHLLQSVWGSGYTDPRLVHAHLSNLRRKIEHGPAVGARHILSVPGVGYRFRAAAD